MLNTLFNSQAKIRALHILLTKHNDPVTPVEVAKKMHSNKNTAKRIMQQLHKAGILEKVHIVHEDKKKKKEIGYRADTSHVLYSELRALFIKSQLLVEGALIERIKKIGGVLLIVLTGVFTGTTSEAGTDMLVVGKVNRKKLAGIIKAFEKKIDSEINYTIMSRQEFEYRRDITDRFLYGILDGNKIVILDRLKNDTIFV